MVYYQEDAPMYFPRVSMADYGVSGLTLTLTSPIDNKTYSYEVEDAENLRDYFVISALDLDELPDGEYEYQLGRSYGLLRKGKIVVPSDEYYTQQDNEYKQFFEYHER